MFDENISILVPYKPDGGQRDKNWSWIRKRYELLLPQAEICVGQYDSEPFSRSAAINSAATLATKNTFIIVDADIVFDIKNIETGINMLSHHAWIIPFIDRIELNKTDTTALLEKDPSLTMSDINFTNYGNYQNGVGSICIIPRKYFEQIGGFDERFKGWGWEDNAFQIAMDKVCGKYARPQGSKIWHLYHAPVLYHPQENSELFHKSYWFKDVKETLEELHKDKQDSIHK